MKLSKENLLQLLITLLALSTAFFISEIANEQNIEIGWGVTLIISIGIITWTISNYLNYRILRIQEIKIKEEYEFENKITGDWIERYTAYDSNSYYCILNIIYNDANQNLHLKGRAYDKNGNKLVRWESRGVYFDRHKKSIFYIYNGEFKDGERGHGYGMIDFINSKYDTINTAVGYFEDAKNNNKPISFELDRIDKIAKLINTKIPENTIDVESFIVEYDNYLSKEKTTNTV